MDQHENAEIIYHIREVTEHGNYNDSLYFNFEDWKALEKDDLAKRVQARVDNWIKVITTPVEPRIPTKEELLQAKQYILEQMAQVDAQMTELYSVEEVKPWKRK
jgi:hypothetical protein